MQRCDDRHSQFSEERQDVTASRPAKNTELVLQADDIHIADVEKVRGAPIGRQVLLLNFEANHLRILVATRNVVDRYGEALALGMRAGDRRKQVRRERRNAALSRQVVAHKSDLSDCRRVFQAILSAVTMKRSGAGPTKPKG